MDIFLQEIAKQFPTLIIIFAIAAIAWLGIREYRKARSETEAEVEKIVNARLGETLSLVQEKISTVDIIVDRQVRKMEAADQRFTQFSNEIAAKEVTYNEVYEQATRQLGELREAIPDVEQESASELLERARSAKNSHVAAALCDRISMHVDATSRDLEAAGDVASSYQRWSLALTLYEAAHRKDPDNTSAHFELLAARAVHSYEMREEALAQAQRLLLSNITESGLRTIAGAFLKVGRHREMVELADRILEITDHREKSIRAQTYRNKAISLRYLRRLDECEAAYSNAFEIAPNDENILRPYLALLEEQGNDAAYIEISNRLIEIDPADPSYYIGLADFYSKRGQHELAIKLINTAQHLDPAGLDARMMIMIRARARAFWDFSNGGTQVGP